MNIYKSWKYADRPTSAILLLFEVKQTLSLISESCSFKKKRNVSHYRIVVLLEISGQMVPSNAAIHSAHRERRKMSVDVVCRVTVDVVGTVGMRTMRGFTIVL